MAPMARRQKAGREAIRFVMACEAGHLDEVDLHVTVDYGTARALLVDGQPQAAMSAFMAGKIRVDGDLAKLMAVQSTSPDAAALAFAAEVRALTA